MNYTILLEDTTVGTLIADIEPAIGETVTVSLPDENGNPFEKTGVVSEVLDETGYLVL